MAQGRQATKKSVDTLQAIPTKTHMALLELQERGLLKGLISQNCDGLHRRSGIRAAMISELHGNTNIECCKHCGKEFLRGTFSFFGCCISPARLPPTIEGTGTRL